ncbi:MAG: hypothetical protein JWQ71_190 [Pedosphaera sp.]|nr:hypothetical protein [Pedosphaera sp.]
MVSILCGLVLLAGCSTTPLVNWDSRIGNYTYQEATADLGPPERSTTLKDGSIVAEWVTRRSTPGTIGIGQTGDIHTPPFWANPLPNTFRPTPEQHLQLTFGPDRLLTRWQRFEV